MGDAVNEYWVWECGTDESSRKEVQANTSRAAAEAWADAHKRRSMASMSFVMVRPIQEGSESWEPLRFEVEREIQFHFSALDVT